MGHAFAAGAGNLPHNMNPLHSEAMSYLKGLQTAHELGMTLVVVETDSTMPMYVIIGGEHDKSALGVTFWEIKIFGSLNFACFVIVHCPRGYNKVANTLAAFGVRMGLASSIVWLDGAPDFVHTLIASDVAGCSG